MEVYPRLHHISLGATSRYAIVSESGDITLTDPGSSSHLSALEERLSRSGLSLSRVVRVLVTHLDADRVGALPALREKIPGLQLVGTSAMESALKKGSLLEELADADLALASELGVLQGKPPTAEALRKALRFEKLLADGESLAIDEDIAIRCVSTPGHREHSVSYLVQPHGFLISDETLGYYNGRRLSAPGADFSMSAALTSIGRFSDLELSGIGFSYGGCITGGLVRKHLEAIVQNTKDLLAEVKRAKFEGLGEEEIRSQVREAFYLPALQDACLVRSLQHTLDSVWSQAKAAT